MNDPIKPISKPLVQLPQKQRLKTEAPWDGGLPRVALSGRIKKGMIAEKSEVLADGSSRITFSNFLP